MGSSLKNLMNTILDGGTDVKKWRKTVEVEVLVWLVELALVVAVPGLTWQWQQYGFDCTVGGAW